MRYTRPHYYKEFTCIGSQCTDTCCAGWEIEIDKKTLNQYNKVQGTFGNRLHNSINYKKSSFQQYDGKCAFLNEGQLCDIYSEVGAHMLCDTCRMYPRHVEVYDNVRDISLALSCPEVARIILSCKEPIRFLSEIREDKEYECTNFDDLLYDKLLKARNICFELLQTRDWDIRERMSTVLAFTHDLQRRMDNQGYVGIDDVINRYQKNAVLERVRAKLSKYQGNQAASYEYKRKMVKMLFQLEVLSPSWLVQMKAAYQFLYKAGETEYSRKRQKFDNMVGYDSYKKGNWNCFNEQLMVYFVFNYFCGAVYDKKAYVKMKFAVVCTILIQELLFALWLKQGEALEASHMIRLVHQFAREIEHSDKNLNKIEKKLSNQKRYNLESLLVCILN